jgi:hypothetical protein
MEKQITEIINIIKDKIDPLKIFLFGSSVSKNIHEYSDLYSPYPADFGILPDGQPDKNNAIKALDFARAINALIRPAIKESL